MWWRLEEVAIVSITSRRVRVVQIDGAQSRLQVLAPCTCSQANCQSRKHVFLIEALYYVISTILCDNVLWEENHSDAIHAVINRHHCCFRTAALFTVGFPRPSSSNDGGLHIPLLTKHGLPSPILNFFSLSTYIFS